MALGKSLKECAQLGTVAATYALEHLGGQSHAYTKKEFTDRYAEHSARRVHSLFDVRGRSSLTLSDSRRRSEHVSEECFLTVEGLAAA
jgi:hypothetical protein